MIDRNTCNRNLDPATLEVLAVTEKAVEIAKRHIATGEDVSQENVAILNRARQALAKFKPKE